MRHIFQIFKSFKSHELENDIDVSLTWWPHSPPVIITLYAIFQFVHLCSVTKQVFPSFHCNNLDLADITEEFFCIVRLSR